ncbi:MAG TPA: FliA/WhiG family RNA polymerase sigma factor [Gemmatimonadales bacterium]|nr:FliA/WhiG family RNA polymerase sigma factor [Gemmatimonadales bacterium]
MTAIPMSQAQATLTDALWARYRASGDPSARAQLLDRYLGLVHHVAREIGARTPAVELDELVSAGTLGLVRALDSFDLSRGLAFSTYAVRRIRGSILDELRSRDWTPRSVRSKGRKLQAVVSALQGQLGRAPEPREVAAALGIDLETYWQWRSAVEGNVLVSFDGVPSSGSGTLTLEETLEDADVPAPGKELDEEEQVRQLRAAIARLPERERTVLALYYYEELNLRQIAEILHVTESRVSQIRTQALKRMRERFGGALR